MITTPMTQPLQMPIEAFAERAYLEYAMYVVLDRALPHIADGLKPVQRRIVYAMRELGLQSGSKFKKSARTVGDVLGKFHPHGDQACYEAMVLLAQDFASRYPLLEGQGNWGSIDDPKSFAAMRYTEARLSPYASLLIDELRLGATDWINNFDGTVQEPQLLPARLPNILLNGASGIAVGMATDIPPHNLREVVDACICLLDNPGATTEALMNCVPAPDYPGGGVIVTSAADRLSLYESGNGSIKLRARYHVEDDTVVVTELPYQSSAGRICEQIAAQVEAKKLPWIDDIRDESDQDERVRLVMVLRSRRVDVDALMLHLFATTDLERSHRVQMNVINRTRRPEVMGLKLLLNEWLMYRRDTVTRRLRHRLAAIEERLHLLDGLLVVYAHIDAVIAVIRGEDHPREALMQTFSLTEQQAEAILAIRLRQLAKLEEIKLREEAAALGSEGSDIEAILASPARLTALLRDEMRADAAVYGDERRSECVADAPVAAPVAALTTAMRAEAATVVLSRNGWIRVAKGEVDGASLSYKTNDACGWSVVTMTDRDVLCFDNTGRAYTLPVQRLPGARGYGEPVSKYIDLPAGAELRALTAVTDNSHIVLLSDSGYGFVVEGHECVGRTKTGKVVMKPADDDSLRFADMLSADEAHEWYVAILSSDGRLLLISLLALPVLARGKGSRLIRLADGATVAAMVVYREDDTLSLHTSRKQHLLSPAHWQGFIGKRAGRGKPLPRGMTTATQLTRQPRTGDTANE